MVENVARSILLKLGKFKFAEVHACVDKFALKNKMRALAEKLATQPSFVSPNILTFNQMRTQYHNLKSASDRARAGVQLQIKQLKISIALKQAEIDQLTSDMNGTSAKSAVHIASAIFTFGASFTANSVSLAAQRSRIISAMKQEERLVEKLENSVPKDYHEKVKFEKETFQKFCDAMR